MVTGGPRGGAHGADGRRGQDDGAAEPEAPDLPLPVSSPVPLSQTVWAGGRVAGATAPVAVAAPAVSATGDDELLEAEDAPKPLHERPWLLPGVALLDPPLPEGGVEGLDHDRNIRIIEEKLRSFQIPATVGHSTAAPW